MTERISSSHRVSLGALALVLSLPGCPKSSEDKPSPTASASVPASGGPAASGHAARGDGGTAASAGSAGAAATEGAAASYAGTYTLAPVPYYVPEAKDYSQVKQAKDDPTKHVGEGALTLNVDPAGRVTGVIDSGPAAPAIIDGAVVEGGEVRGNVRRKAPEDVGLTGTIVAKLGGGAGEGKLSLAEGNAAIVRAGAVSLKKK
jgi:hypothetical protein